MEAMASRKLRPWWRWCGGLVACLLVLSGCDMRSLTESVAPLDVAEVRSDSSRSDGQAATPNTNVAGPQAQLAVYYFDVGQGDATLLAGPDFTILIDAGRHNRSEVVPYLRQAGVESIDLLIGTHPHADHIGQFPQVLKSFPVQDVWMCGNSNNTLAFSRAVDAIVESGAGYHEPRAGEAYRIGSSSIKVIHPTNLTSNLNDNSVSVRITFREVAFLFTGDVEANGEWEMVERGMPLRAQILKMGHHGSKTSSHTGFLGAVRPQVAIYSCGADNSYGHPHPEALHRVQSMGIEVFGTDRHGTVQVVTDGKYFRVFTERGQQQFARQPGEPTLIR